MDGMTPETPPAGLASCLTLHGPVRGFPKASKFFRVGWAG